jgi:hypothetical protein
LTEEVELTKYPYDGRYYLNGFPKSGLHRIALMVYPLATPQEMPDNAKPWAGTFTDFSWTTNWRVIDDVLWRCAELTPGHHMYAHAGYRHELERFLWWLGAAHIFVYRDLRDVAVSQVHHILSDDVLADGGDRLVHPDKKLYRDLGSFENILVAIIEGYCRFAGIITRWNLYAPWLNVPWVQKVTFEDSIRQPRLVADTILTYGLARVSQIRNAQFEFLPDMKEEVLDEMVRAADSTQISPTFRKGEIGGWREHFTPRVRDAFREAGGDPWLVRLKYEENDQW